MGQALQVRVGECLTMADVLIAMPDLAAVDRMINARGGAFGIYEIGGVRLYFGPVEDAAAEFGGEALFVGTNGDIWIRTGPDSARQLAPFVSPAGRELWMPTNSAGRCRPGIPN